MTGLAPEIPEDLYMLIKKVIYISLDSISEQKLTEPGRCRAQAPRAQPERQGLQVPPHSHRVADPPPRALLQVGRRTAAQLEIRERDSQHHRGIRAWW